MPTLTATERIGSMLGGRYEVRRLLGEGGFSAVFEAVHTITGREVAVKLLHPHLTSTEQITERFLMEARAMARIKHDGIVQVLDAGSDPDGSVYIALELLDGESLESTLLRVGRLTWGEAVSICNDVLDALGEAHRHQIVHRDIKPGNIFIVRKPDGSSQAKLLDFGIAHVAQAKNKLTTAGMILGTPEYMSPEQGRTANVGPESDLWSVGIVMWECLTGHTPFVAETATEILLKIATVDAPPIESEVDDIPPSVAAVINRSLAREISQRYRSADEMREALQRAVRRADEAAATVSSSPSPTPRPVPRAPEPRVGARPATQVSAGGPMVRPPVASAAPRLPNPALSGGASTTHSGTNASAARAAGRSATPSGSAATSSPTTSHAGGDIKLSASPQASPAQPVLRASPAPQGVSAPEPVNVKAPAIATSDEIPVLSFEERESRTFSGRAGDFQKPPDHPARSSTFVLGVAALAMVAVGGYVALSSDDPPPHPPPPPSPPPPVVVVDASPTTSTTTDVPETPEMATFAPINEVGLPAGVVGADNATEFARHSAASYHAGTTQRMIATCVPGGGEGSALYLHPMTFGQLRGASRGLVACAGFDLGVVSDVTADGSDDVVAVSSRRDDLLIVNSQSLRPHRTIEIVGVKGIAVNTQIVVRSEPVMVVYAEPRGADDPTEVRAVSAVSSRVWWRYRGSGALPRVGHPIELGLAVGPDATGDGVGDVVLGAGPALDTASTNADARRCVLLLSGADGRVAWQQPFCRSRAGGLQSVSIGPDVNGDTRADVVVGTDQPGDGEAPVVLLSGVDGTVIRQFAAPGGDTMQGFGWPVVLSGDVDGDHMPDILVGVIGANPSVQVFDAASARLRGALPAGGVGSANLRVFSVPALLAENPWSILVADPANGLRVYMRRQTDEAL